VVTDYWLRYKMATIEFGDTNRDHALKSKFAIVTIHDICPAYSNKLFKAADELEKLAIPFNFAVIPQFKRKQEDMITNNIQGFRKNAMDALLSLGFSLAETEEEILLLN
jgi:Uncharacterized protein conserved in bacteria (DUF2334)